MFLFPSEYVLGKNLFLALSTGGKFGLLMLACRDRKKKEQKNPTNFRLRVEREEFWFPLSAVTFVTWAKARLKHVSTVGKLINTYLCTATL